MPEKEKVLQLLLKQKLLPLYYHESTEISVGILQALYEAGIRMVEYTNRGEQALANFIILKNEVQQSMPGMLLGIGTIKNAAMAGQYIDVGADFIVCPTVNEAVATTSHNAGLLWIPGCMTPTEIATAESLEANIVKVFPGNILGPSFITAVKELFPLLKFMPTGGVEVNEDNLKAWFGSGAKAVGMGSKLISKELWEKRDYAGLKAHTQLALQLIGKIAVS